MRRRDFIKVVAGSATAWPFMARAQERIRLVGLLNILAEDDPESRLRIAAFKKSLQELCWTDGSIRIEARWAGGDVERLRKHAKELVALGPDVILTSGSVTVRPLQQATRTMTRVAVVRDPVNGSGIAQFAVIQACAPPLGVELIPIDARDVREIDRGITAFSRFDNGGLIVTSGGTGYHRDVIIPLAVRFRLPAVYPYRYYATDGGLASYGPNTINW
ncbi:MAG: hypothetical protein WCF56_20695 [Pseudolabrys sp.]